MDNNKIRFFEKIFNYLIYVEGGYTDDRYDKGGKTKYGIIEVEARKYGYKGLMKDLTLELAKEIYFKKYFIKNKLDKIDNEEIALSICDWTVNSGAWGLKKAQQTLNELGYNLVVDGIFGNKTLQALNTVDVNKFLEIYHNKQRLFYNNIVKNNPTQKKFLQGWLNRVSRKENYLANNMEIVNHHYPKGIVASIK